VGDAHRQRARCGERCGGDDGAWKVPFCGCGAAIGAIADASVKSELSFTGLGIVLGAFAANGFKGKNMGGYLVTGVGLQAGKFVAGSSFGAKATPLIKEAAMLIPGVGASAHTSGHSPAITASNVNADVQAATNLIKNAQGAAQVVEAVAG